MDNQIFYADQCKSIPPEGYSTRPASILALALAALLLASMSECAPDTRQVVQASEILEKIEQGEPVEYDGVIVEGDLDLSGRTLNTVHFNNTIFQGSVRFEGTNFTGDAWFIGANFNGSASFYRADFSGGNAYFSGADFSGGNANFARPKFQGGSAIFYETEFSGGDANFVEAEFSGGDANFAGANFTGGDAYFLWAEFSGGDANFAGAEFSGGSAIFYETEFSGGSVYFAGAEFTGGSAIFNEAEFSGGSAIFNGAEFSGGVSFIKAEFSGGDNNFAGAEFSGGSASFNEAEFSGGDANFVGAKFSGGSADFSNAEFKEIAQFSNVTFNVSATLTGAQFSKRTYFNLAAFNGSASFEDAQFSGNAYFENTAFKSNLNLNRTGYTRFFLRWNSVSESQLSASDYDAYLALMRNYVNLGWFEDSNNCYYEYRNKHRMSEPISFGKIIDTFEWILYGYGVKPSRTAVGIVFLIIGFGLVFSYCGSIKKYIREEHVENSTDETTGGNKSEAAEIKTVFKRGEISVIDPFLFSFIIVTFTSGFVSFLYPTIEYRAEKNKVLIMVERFLGYVFLALLITAFSKTYLIR